MSAARVKSWAWKLVTVPIIGLIYCVLISEGLRYLFPALAQRLYKLPIPGLSYLRDYEAFYRLDLAHLFSIFLFIAVWYLWVVNLRAYLGDADVFNRSGWNPEAYRRFVLRLGVVVLGADAILFYIAITQQGWFGNRFSFTALVATVIYVAVIIFVSFVSVNLERPLKEE